MVSRVCSALLPLLILSSVATEPASAQPTFGAQQRATPRDALPEKKGTAVIRGKVTSAENGRPLRRVQVSISSPELSEARSVSTNSLGVFEARDLPAGRYTVTANRSGYLRLQYGQRRPGEAGRPFPLGEGERAENIDLVLPRMGVIAGRVTDEAGEPLANVSVFPMQIRYFRGKRRVVPIGGQARTDDTGQFRLLALEPGEYYVMGTTRETWTMEGNENERVGFGPTYYPGTMAISDAQRVKVGLGQEIAPVDFAMVPGRAATIGGTATTASGMPLAGEQVSMSQEFAGPGWSSMFGFGGAKVAADGTFTIKNVGPGEYKLSVRTPGSKERPSESAAATISVTGADIEGVSLVAGSGGSIAGRVVTDTGALPSFPLARLTVSARPVDPDTTYQRFSEDNGRVKEDWTFELTDVAGAQKLSVGPLPTGWAVKSIDHAGRDLADAPIEVRHGQRLDGVTVVVSNRLPTVAGALVDRNGQPAEGTVILFTEDESRWGETSRLVRTARPDAAGGFEMRLVPPGDYLIAGVEYVRNGDWEDPEYLQRLRDGATKLTLADGAAKSVTVVLKRD